MGSGKLLKRAIKKYGVENFKKDILLVLDSEEEMNQKEKELVVVSEGTYNLCPGGHGGFGYINTNKLGMSSEKSKSMHHSFLQKLQDPLFKKEFSLKVSKGGFGRKDRVCKPETREKIRLAKLGKPRKTLFKTK